MSPACETVRDELLAEMRGELAPFPAGEVRAHVEGCPACRAEREEMARLARLLAAEPMREPAPDGFLRIRRRIEEEEGNRSRRGRLLLLLPAAAAALLLALLLPSFLSSPPTLAILDGSAELRGAALGPDPAPFPAGSELTARTPCRVDIAGPRDMEAVLDAGTRLGFEGAGTWRIPSGRALLTVRPGAGEVAFSTPAGLVVVTGTRLSLSVDADHTDCAVLEGEVTIRTGSHEPVRVVSGHALRVAPGEAPGEPRAVDPWRVRDWCSRPEATLSSPAPGRLVLRILNPHPLPLVLRPYDPSSAAYSLRVRDPGGRLVEREIRIQDVMVIHDGRAPEGPDPIVLGPGDAYELTVDPALALSSGTWSVAAVYKPYRGLPEDAWRGVLETEFRTVTIE